MNNKIDVRINLCRFYFPLSKKVKYHVSSPWSYWIVNVKVNMFVINIIIKVAYMSGKPGMCVSVGGHKCRWEV